MARNIILYIATSLDGFIARENGEIDWLFDPSEMDYGYNEFIQKIDTVLMGRKTYDKVLTFGEYPYKDKKSYVFTTKQKENDVNVEFISTDIMPFIENLKKVDGKDIWLVGGAELTKFFLKNRLIDELILFVQPTIIGSGIPLFQDIEKDQQLTLQAHKIYENGMVEVRYEWINV
ncbi:dihydrofolate reductase family protein [Gottfriedia luciferensis]|uniref:dihydrofolate reductase family protein n=1 Tax=Gottfriedia luciferensis TaxID=178774 RepID=UPI000B44B1B5|nr:dihydrofolate reductase family protein [Gottfriedia luciferensis]